MATLQQILPSATDQQISVVGAFVNEIVYYQLCGAGRGPRGRTINKVVNYISTYNSQSGNV